MYARSFGHRRLDPASLLAATGLSALTIAALLGSAPHVTRAIQDTLEGYAVPLAPPPPPDPLPQTSALPRQHSVARPDVPRPVVAPPPDASDFTVDVAQPTLATVDTGSGGVVGPVAVEPPRVPPVFVAPGIDPRYAHLLQPPYPSDEQRLGREGSVAVRVLVGVDGRVRQVERVGATSDAFFRAVERQALARWRFRPGTRDGIPVEAWRAMTLRFVLE